MPLGTQRRTLEGTSRQTTQRLIRPACPTSTTLRAPFGASCSCLHRSRLGRGLRNAFSNLICRAAAFQSQNDFMTRQIARLSQSVSALSAPLTIFNSQTPLDRCLATNQASACLIPVSCRSNPSRDNESSDDKRSVNQNGYENFVQKTAALLSGYTSRRKNREASSVPAFIAADEARRRSCAAKARTTTPVTR